MIETSKQKVIHCRATHAFACVGPLNLNKHVSFKVSLMP